jgi:hypothetical protein
VIKVIKKMLHVIHFISNYSSIFYLVYTNYIHTYLYTRVKNEKKFYLIVCMIRYSY